MGCGTLLREAQTPMYIDMQLLPTKIRKFDDFYKVATERMREIQSVLSNVEVVLDMFGSRTGLHFLPRPRPIGYAIISLLAAISASQDCNFIKIDLRIVSEFPGIIIHSRDIPDACSEIYELWVRFTQVLEESVDKLNEFSANFPDIVENCKSFPQQLQRSNFDPEHWTKNDLTKLKLITEKNAVKVEEALLSLGLIIDKVKSSIIEGIDILDLLARKESINTIHRLGKIFLEKKIFDPSEILQNYYQLIDEELPIS